MYAVIEAAGRQYRVEPGETVKMEKIAGEPGTAVVFDKVLMVTTDAGAQIGKSPGQAGNKANFHWWWLTTTATNQNDR